MKGCHKSEKYRAKLDIIYAFIITFFMTSVLQKLSVAYLKYKIKHLKAPDYFAKQLNKINVLVTLAKSILIQDTLKHLIIFC